MAVLLGLGRVPLTLTRGPVGRSPASRSFMLLDLGSLGGRSGFSRRRAGCTPMDSLFFKSRSEDWKMSLDVSTGMTLGLRLDLD